MNSLNSLTKDKKKPALFISLLLIVVTLLVFDRVREFDFVHYDDDVYVLENRHVQSGITIPNIVWAFTSAEAGFWHPFTWLSLMLDGEMYGRNAGGYHGTNLILHMLSTILLFSVFSAMTQSPWRSAFVAALFAIHPFHVESVAWIAERKDVLSTIFWLLTMGAYVHYVRRPGLFRYFLVLFTFSLGLMAKPMLVTLPFCLLLLDVWPLGRTRWWQASSAQEGRLTADMPAKRAPLAPLLLFAEKIPLFVLSLMTALLVYYTENRAGVLASLDDFPLAMRLSHALVSYVVYLGKSLWPVNLAVFYPHPGGWPFPAVLFALAFLIAVTVISVRSIARFPYAAVGWLWFLGVLAPVIGVVQLGTQGMADRYTYVSLIGIFLVIAWGAPDCLKKWRKRDIFLPIAAVAVLILTGSLAWRQVGYWQDGETLFSHALRVTRNNYLAHNNLGAALDRKGNVAAALTQYNEALLIKPYYADALFNKGQALAAGGRVAEAEQSFRDALQAKPLFPEAHNNLAIILAFQGKKKEAASHFSAALRIRPAYEAAANNLRLLGEKP